MIPAGDQDQKDEEKLENVPVDIAGSGSLVVCYHETDRADR
jgi:hypothetical protein